MLANPRERDLQLLKHPEQPLRRAEPGTEPVHGSGDLPRVQRVADLPVRGQAAPQLTGQAIRGLGGDQAELDLRQPRRCFDEPRRCVEQVRRDKDGGHHPCNVGPFRPPG